MTRRRTVLGLALAGLVGGATSAVAQDVPRQFTDAQVKTASLETCQDGAERTGTAGRQVGQVMMDLGWSRINAGDPYGAAEAFVSAANIGPARPDSYWGLGVAAHIAGWPDDVLQSCFGRVQGLLPDEPGPWADHGRARQERGQDEAAIVRLREALKRDPDFTAAHIGLAKAYLNTGDTENAERHALRVQELTRAR